MKEQAQSRKGLVRSSVYNGLAKFSALFFGIASTLLLTRTLTESELGVWAQFLLFTTVGEIIRHSLVRNALLTLSQRMDEAQGVNFFGRHSW